jgi:hypothetical protein
VSSKGIGLTQDVSAGKVAEEPITHQIRDAPSYVEEMWLSLLEQLGKLSEMPRKEVPEEATEAEREIEDFAQQLDAILSAPGTSLSDKIIQNAQDLLTTINEEIETIALAAEKRLQDRKAAFLAKVEAFFIRPDGKPEHIADQAAAKAKLMKRIEGPLTSAAIENAEVGIHEYSEALKDIEDQI